MRCIGCGNLIQDKQSFCKHCGRKAEGKKINYQVAAKLMIAVVLVIAVIIIVWSLSRGKRDNLPDKTISKSDILEAEEQAESKPKFNPVGIWKIAKLEDNNPIEFRFSEDGSVKIGVSGIYKSGMEWKLEGENTIYISGSFPEVHSLDFGEVGIYAVYEEESRTLLLQLGDKFLRLKNKETN